MTPSCLQKQGHGENLGSAGAQTRQLTLEEILYPPRSWEMEATRGTPARRNSPKVCPMNYLDFSSESSENESPAIDQSVSIISRAASVRSQNSSVCRRVSFRSPDESDVFIIPARSDSDDEDDDDDSSDGE
ncbi:hypothetical protein PR202_ga21402 [Eleusine coracana subsp. coracana]|uniref:Uncharacterized protein n=1 Tax=Eleusine coracana subsp. coracana TaxID=191504 RepID=A0AAV5D199_ELECO|nr:hypothetical protein PR202_ga21402 [Eleusine coracana subsp. coracana]